MKEQKGLKEWIVQDQDNMKFHMGQFDNPYRSTVLFGQFLEKNLSEPTDIVDFGCGAGAPLSYLVENCKVVNAGYGLDISQDVIECGKRMINDRQIENVTLEQADFYNLHVEHFPSMWGGIALQVVNVMKDYRKLFLVMDKLNPEYIAFSTLGFEGNIDYMVELHDYNKKKEGDYTTVFYNIYSLPIMKKYFQNLGYPKFVFEKFIIDIDIPQSNTMGRGTYTIKKDNGERIQISGGMMMPWYFVLAKK